MTNGFSRIAQEQETLKDKIDFKDIKVSKLQVISSLGYTNGILPSHFEKMIDVILDQLSNYCTFQAGYRTLDIRKL